MKVALISLLCLILAGAIERLALHRSLLRIPIRVVVNGTRGKSTVVRLLAAALDEAGIPALGRSTGSAAELVLPDGSIRRIDRRGVVNLVREQRHLARLANVLSVRALVCECSAIRPELQRVFQRQLVEPTLTLITNSYVDHVDQMGKSRESTAGVLASGVRRFLTTDPVLGSLPGAVIAPQVPVPSCIPPWVHPDCYRIALVACMELGIPQKVAIKGMCNVRGDIGTGGDVMVCGRRFINAFARNDTTTTRQLLATLDLSETSIVFANRWDREFRLERFAGCFQSLGVDSLFVIGDHPALCARIFRSHGMHALCVPFPEIVARARQTVVLTGNIKGDGQRLLSFLKEQAP